MRTEKENNSEKGTTEEREKETKNERERERDRERTFEKGNVLK